MKAVGTPTSLGPTVRALIGAALLIGGTVTLALSSPGYLDPDVARRWLGVLPGLAVVVYANAAPKALPPWSHMRGDPAVEQARRRFTGWSLTLGGGAYIGAWLVAPLAIANVLATSVLGASLVLALVHCRWMPARRARA